MYIFLKRFIDFTSSFFLIILLSPFFLIIALLIKISDNGPILYTQKRVGLNGRLFDLYKFRSMKNKAEGTFYTQENDPRITKIGKVLRQLSLDELPQLFNVLKGEMSLIGPRPDVELQQQSYTEDQRVKRNSVLPGITGLAQATKRSLATFEERLALDLEYITSLSLVMDVKVVILTLQSFFKKNKN